MNFDFLLLELKLLFFSSQIRFRVPNHFFEVNFSKIKFEMTFSVFEIKSLLRPSFRSPRFRHLRFSYSMLPSFPKLEPAQNEKVKNNDYAVKNEVTQVFALRLGWGLNFSICSGIKAKIICPYCNHTTS